MIILSRISIFVLIFFPFLSNETFSQDAKSPTITQHSLSDIDLKDEGGLENAKVESKATAVYSKGVNQCRIGEEFLKKLSGAEKSSEGMQAAPGQAVVTDISKTVVRIEVKETYEPSLPAPYFFLIAQTTIQGLGFKVLETNSQEPADVIIKINVKGDVSKDGKMRNLSGTITVKGKNVSKNINFSGEIKAIAYRTRALTFTKHGGGRINVHDELNTYVDAFAESNFFLSFASIVHSCWGIDEPRTLIVALQYKEPAHIGQYRRAEPLRDQGNFPRNVKSFNREHRYVHQMVYTLLHNLIRAGGLSIARTLESLDEEKQIEILEIFGKPDIKELLIALCSPAPKVREKAGKILTRIGWEPPPDPKEKVFWYTRMHSLSAWEKCLDMGAPAIEPLVDIMKDPALIAPRAREAEYIDKQTTSLEWVISCLERLGWFPRDESEFNAYAKNPGLIKYPKVMTSEESFAFLCSICRDSSRLFHREVIAAEALGNRRDPRAVEILVNQGKKNYEIEGFQKAVVGALGKIGTDKALAALKSTISTTYDIRLRDAAIQSLSESKNAKAVETLEKLLEQNDYEVASFIDEKMKNYVKESFQEAVVGALSKIGNDKALAVLESVISTDDTWLRDATIRSLPESKNSKAIEILGKLLNHKDYQVSILAVCAIGRIQSPEARKLLVSALKHNHANVRREAEMALKRQEGSKLPIPSRNQEAAGGLKTNDRATVLENVTTEIFENKEDIRKRIIKQYPFNNYNPGDKVDFMVDKNKHISGKLVELSEKGLKVEVAAGAIVRYAKNRLPPESQAKFYRKDYDNFINTEVEKQLPTIQSSN